MPLLSCVLSAAMMMAPAQESAEAFKRRLLAEVERKLKDEEERILREIERLIDDELRKGPPATPAPTPSPKPPPVEPPRAKGKGFLGVRSAAIEGDAAAELKKRGIAGAVRIMKVVEDSPADSAGLKENDLIIAIGPDAISDPAMLPPLVQSKQAGDKLEIHILRGAKLEERVVTVTLAPLPPQFAPPSPSPSATPEVPEPKPPAHTEDELRERIRKFLEQQPGGTPKPEPSRVPDPPARGPRPWLGIIPEDVSDEVRSQLKIEAGVGVAITAVTEGSPAAKAGLLAGDIVVKLDGRALKGEEALAAFMTAAKIEQKVKLGVLRKGSESEFSVTLGRRP